MALYAIISNRHYSRQQHFAAKIKEERIREISLMLVRRYSNQLSINSVTTDSSVVVWDCSIFDYEIILHVFGGINLLVFDEMLM